MDNIINLGIETENANSIKQTVLEQLQKDGIITPETYLKYNENWQIILVKNGWFRRWLAKFGGEENNEEVYTYRMVKFED